MSHTELQSPKEHDRSNALGALQIEYGEQAAEFAHLYDSPEQMLSGDESIGRQIHEALMATDPPVGEQIDIDDSRSLTVLDGGTIQAEVRGEGFDFTFVLHPGEVGAEHDSQRMAVLNVMDGSHVANSDNDPLSKTRWVLLDADNTEGLPVNTLGVHPRAHRREKALDADKLLDPTQAADAVEVAYHELGDDERMQMASLAMAYMQDTVMTYLQEGGTKAVNAAENHELPYDAHLN